MKNKQAEKHSEIAWMIKRLYPSGKPGFTGLKYNTKWLADEQIKTYPPDAQAKVVRVELREL